MMEFVKALFSYSAREKRGLMILAVLILIVNTLNFTIPIWYPTSLPEVTIHNFYADSLTPTKVDTSIPKMELTDSLFAFDPNTISLTGLIKLGLKPKTANTILNYREKGGKFYKTDDLKKIYGLSDSDFEKLKPLVKIENSVILGNVGTKRKEIKVELNESGKDEWIKLNGIGPVLSARIVKFRDALGGFYSKEQLKEVYGLPDSVYQTIKHLIVEDTLKISIFALENATVEELGSHPYISYSEARAIISYREKEGSIDSLGQLVRLKIISQEKALKLKNYIKP